MVDVPTGQVVTNDYPHDHQDLFFEWRPYHRDGAPDLWPGGGRAEMDEVMERVYTDVNNGVYRCGFAASQEAYDARTSGCSSGSTALGPAGDRRVPLGDTITEADVRLFTTLVRFDAVYHGHFKCNRQKLTELPVLWAYARDLFQTPGFGDTVDFDHIKRHYYEVHRDHQPERHRAARSGPGELAGAARPGGARRVAVRHRHAARSAVAAGDRATGPHPTPLSDPPSVVLGEFAELVGDAAGAGAGRQVADRLAAEPVADRVDRAVQRPAG
jgi:putative glutathione S-transferase